MSDACCSASRASSAPSVGTCPVSGWESRRVEWSTVAALTAGRVPPPRDFWLCEDPDCEVVYFAADGPLLERQDLRVAPGFKRGSTDPLLCYCFLYRQSDVEEELRRSGTTSVPNRIAAEMKSGHCACHVRNPSGKCCLRAVRRAVEEISHRLVPVAS